MCVLMLRSEILSAMQLLRFGTVASRCRAGVTGRRFLRLSSQPWQICRSCTVTRSRLTCAVSPEPCGPPRRNDRFVTSFGSYLSILRIIGIPFVNQQLLLVSSRSNVACVCNSLPLYYWVKIIVSFSLSRPLSFLSYIFRFQVGCPKKKTRSRSFRFDTPFSAYKLSPSDVLRL